MVVSLAVAGLAGCGGGGGSTPGISAPTPTPTPTASATPFPGGSTLAASLTGTTAAVQSIVARFNGSAAPPVAAPPSCASGSCQVTFPALVGSNESVSITTYMGANGSGPALQTATATTTFFANQTTSLNVALSGIMASFTAALNPPSVTVGTASSFAVQVNAIDAAGSALSGGYVNASGAVPVFTASDGDVSGNTSFPGGIGTATTTATLPASAQYSGLGSSSATFTVSTPGYASSSVSLTYQNAAPGTIAYAVHTNSSLSGPAYIREYSPGGTAVVRSYGTTAMRVDVVRFDPSGTLWGPTPNEAAGYVGYKPDGSSAGVMVLPGALLTIDSAGRVYAADAAGTVHVYSVGAGNALTEIRFITPPAQASGAAVDSSGNVYIATADAVREYGSSGSGTLTPIATNTGATAPVTTDLSGNVFAALTAGSRGAVGEWLAGTFSSAPPARTVQFGVLDTDEIAVDGAGTIYLWGRVGFSTRLLFTAAPGSGMGTQTGLAGVTRGSVATPLH